MKRDRHGTPASIPETGCAAADGGSWVQAGSEERRGTVLVSGAGTAVADVHRHPTDPFFTCQRCGDLSPAGPEACLWPSLVALKGDKHHYRTRKCFSCAQAGVPCSCAVDPKDYDFVIEPGQKTVIKDWQGRIIDVEVLKESHRRIIETKRLEGRERERSGRKRKRAGRPDEDEPHPHSVTARYSPAVGHQAARLPVSRGFGQERLSDPNGDEQAPRRTSSPSICEASSSSVPPLRRQSQDSDSTAEATSRPPSKSPLGSLWRHRPSVPMSAILRASSPAPHFGTPLPPILNPRAGPSTVPTLPRVSETPHSVHTTTEDLRSPDTLPAGRYGDDQWQARAKFVRDAERLSGVPLTQSFLSASQTSGRRSHAVHHLDAADSLIRNSQRNLDDAHRKLTGSEPVFWHHSSQRRSLPTPEVEQDEERGHLGSWRERTQDELDKQTRRLQSLRESLGYYGRVEDTGAREARSPEPEQHQRVHGETVREHLDRQDIRPTDRESRRD